MESVPTSVRPAPSASPSSTSRTALRPGSRRSPPALPLARPTPMAAAAGDLANDRRKESHLAGDSRAFGNRITCRCRPPRADGRVPQAASVRARHRRAPHASETAFRCRVRPTPVPKALPSACSGSRHAVRPLPPTGRAVHREAESSMSPGKSPSAKAPVQDGRPIASDCCNRASGFQASASSSARLLSVSRKTPIVAGASTAERLTGTDE